MLAYLLTRRRTTTAHHHCLRSLVMSDSSFPTNRWSSLVSCSAERWILTSRSGGPAPLDEAYSAQSTESSCRWSTKPPCGATWRTLAIDGASTSFWISLWRTVISSGRASQTPRCRGSTDPVALVWDMPKVRGQQRQRLNPRKEEGSGCHRGRGRPAHVRQRDVQPARRTWRRHQERTQG